MLNPFIIKENAVLILAPMFGVIGYIIGNLYGGFWAGMIGLAVMVLVVVLAGKALLANPFTSMLKGKGVLALDINSTGVIRPFILGVKLPYVQGKVNGRFFRSMWNRKLVQNMATPVTAGEAVKDEEKGGLVIKLSEKEYNKSRFAMYHYPVILYNEAVGETITKDFLSENEGKVFATHNVMYLNKLVQDLTSNVRDFGRYIAEQLQPKKSIWASKWTWVVMVIGLVVLALLFAPKILEVLGGGTGGAISNAVSTATQAGANTITPITS